MGRRKHAKAEDLWRDRLAKFRRNQLTVAEFCRRKGESPPSFYQWRKLEQEAEELKLTITPVEGKGSRKARLWIYRSNEAGCEYDVFAFTNSRSHAGPDEFLQHFEGTLTGDFYSGYVNIELVTNGRIAFSACNAHARRYIFNAREQDAALSSHCIALYRALYDIEDRIRHGKDPHPCQCARAVLPLGLNRVRAEITPSHVPSL